MSKKEKCKEIMNELFGEASASLVENMSEEEVVEKCKEKTKTFLGEDAAKKFDNIQ